MCFPVPACKRLKHSTHDQMEETLNEEKWLGRYEEDRSTKTQGEFTIPRPPALPKIK